MSRGSNHILPLYSVLKLQLGLWGIINELCPIGVVPDPLPLPLPIPCSNNIAIAMVTKSNLVQILFPWQPKLAVTGEHLPHAHFSY